MTFDHNHLSNILGSEPVDLRSENAELRVEVKRLREENVDLRNSWGKITERLDLPEDVSIGKVLEVMCDRYAVELAESEIARRDQEIERLIDEKSAFTLAICKYCDMWRPGERVNGGGNENTH